MAENNNRHYWLIHLNSPDIDWNTFTVREVRETFIKGLEKNIKYISVINKVGQNIYKSVGHSVRDLDNEEWIEVFDEVGNLDIVKTADVVTKDFLDNRAMIGMRFEGDMYDELGPDRSWIDTILGGR